MNRLLNRIGGALSQYLAKPRHREFRPSTCDFDLLSRTLSPGDVLLVEGSSRFSSAIKYLTQSRWSHAALYVGGHLNQKSPDGMPLTLVEADVNEGIRALSLAEYRDYHVRICRPVGLTEEEINQVIGYAIDRLGHQYDLKNIIDLVRYLIRTPPVPTRWRRQMLQLGSGDPTRAICSSLIAQAYQAVRYPILPERILEHGKEWKYRQEAGEILRIRHHSLFVPADFDISPYFQVIKPTLDDRFDPHQLHWHNLSTK